MQQFIDVQYVPGTIKSRQHTEITSPAFTDTNHVHFQEDGRCATIAPYSFNSDIDEISGICRAIYAQRITGAQEGDYYFFATHSHLYVELRNVRYNITPLKATSITLGTDPLAITNGDATVIVTHTAHGYADGDRIKMDGIAGALNGVPAGDFNREHIITYINANSYSIEVATVPTSTDATAGGASVAVYGQIAAGNSVQQTSSGMGAGDFGGGLFGAGGTSASGVTDYPRIWSFDPFGNEVVMCPGDYAAGDGQKIYIWDGDTDVAPTVLTNAPTDCNWIRVVNNAIVALCGRTVKICEPGDGTVWSGLSYYEKTLERVDLLHSAWRHDEKEAVIHYGNGAVLLRYVGEEGALWDLSDLYEDDAVISPMATVRVGGVLVWRGRKAFYTYDGGIVRQFVNQQNNDWIIANQRAGKEWHSFCVADNAKGEFYYHFATGSDDEPGNYVIGNLAQQSFTLGLMDRTAAQRPSALSEVFYMADSDGSTTDVYLHFTKGATTFDWYAETAFFYVGNGEQRFLIDEFRPDANQSGDILLEVIGREYEQGEDVALGSAVISYNSTHISLNASARLIKFRFSGSSEATFGRNRVRIRLLGRR